MQRALIAGCFVAIAAALSGCSSGKTFVLDRPMPDGAPMAIAFSPNMSTVEIDEKTAASFESKLAAKLQKSVTVTNAQSADLVLKYRIVNYDAGSGAARVGSGVASLVGSPFYGVGDGSVGVEVMYADRSGKSVGRIVVEGQISGAFGSTDAAVDSAASMVAMYTDEHFLRRRSAEPAKQ